MKKIIFLALFSFGMASLTQAQLGGLANKAAAAGFDVNKLDGEVSARVRERDVCREPKPA